MAKRKRKSQSLVLQPVTNECLAAKYGGTRQLGRGYFCLFFVLPPEPRESVLCLYPKCPDYEKCLRQKGPSRIVYDRALDYAAQQLKRGNE